MKLKLSLIAAFHCLAVVFPHPALNGGREPAKPEPAWLHRMLQEGWQQVQDGVLQRALEGGRRKTFTYGQAGQLWMVHGLQERIKSLQREYDQHPSMELADVIASLKSLAADSSLSSATQADSFAVDRVTVGCFTVNAAADPLMGSQGVTASADASYNSPCSALGHVHAYAYARATTGTTMNVKIQEDAKNNGTSLASAATVSVNGALDCYSEAWSVSWSPALGLSYQASDTNSSCPGAHSPPPQANATPKIAPEPAATLLLPYFEVALDNANGIQTLFSINNAASQAALAHVVVWSDLSVPVLDFNIYLTGYDVQNINLRDIFVNGVLPRTASAGQDPADTISPQGDFSQDINFASCQGQLPPPNLPSTFITHLQNSLTGQSSAVLGNRCAGRNLGDRIARGYITVDTVNNCTLRFPGDAGYFGFGGTGDATNQNVLWGDYFYVNSGQNFAQGETLVHLVADATDPETSVPGQYTFYGRYVGWTAIDNRKPLATNFAVRYINGGITNGGTDLLVWRDSKVIQSPFTCPAVAGARPAGFPLGQEGIMVFDEQENPEVPQAVSNLSPFPAEAQRTSVDSGVFPVASDFGWLYLNMNTAVSAAGNNPPEDPAAAQAWVTVVMDAEGRFSMGFDAVQIDNASHARHHLPGN
ncbi:MAG TPA: hypothetical protein VHN15_09640 [Thermoanaerobaculia bacterium]|nr:hypothetical protein [Thermoanaerobaculia bacterium]